MEYSRFLDCLAADFARLRAVVPTDLRAPVPSCPGWTVADLTRHVADVYLHKTLAMREGAEPDPWPPKEFADEEPLALLDRAHAGLLDEFAARKPEDPAGSWYTPDQTVGFWIRRMAQETVIHRIDAELGTGQQVSPVPADLAIDGIDELLTVFVAYSVAGWGDYFTDILAGSPGRTYTVRTDGAAWRVRTGPGLFAVDGGADSGAGDDAADVTVSGPPTAVLRWMWNWEGAGEPAGVTVEGVPEAVEELRRCIVTATQ
ncbi:maleylpyruvate isomerase family mycothiol-dependent enzyme [Streptomyces sp. NPDC020681]|uniref:maleylpyruvate isomerase family mycothiol-dependent enzyme n=1 Tax=Streptomyces sp. NPDC020681 TaxID=3365083 RepID=UPI003796D34A